MLRPILIFLALMPTMAFAEELSGTSFGVFSLSNWPNRAQIWSAPAAKMCWLA